MPLARVVAAVAALSLSMGSGCTGSGGGAAPGGGTDSGAEGGGTQEGGASQDGAAAGPGVALVAVDPSQAALDEVRSDGVHVFYTRIALSAQTFKHASIEALPVGGGAPTVLAPDVVEPSYLVLDDTYVYFARYVCNAGIPCGVFRVAKTGGAVQTLASDPDAGMPLVVTGMAVDDTYVYFGVQGYDQLWRVKKDGSSAAEAVTTSDVGIQGVQVDAQYVYWVDATVGSVKFLRLAKGAASGAAPDTLATSTGSDVGHTPTNVRAASMTDTEIVWAECGDSSGTANSIVRLPKTPGGAITQVQTGLRYIGSAKASGTRVFFTDGSLEALPLAGGTPQALASYPYDPKTLAPIDVDATAVYWITSKEIRRLPL